MVDSKKILNQIKNSETKSTKLISQRLIDLCNYRIQQEEYSSRIYSAMSRWLDDKSYVGAAKLWKKYSDEELTHAEIIYSFLLDLGIRPVTPELPKPQQDFKGLVDIVNLSYEHEVEVYNQCSELAKVAFEENQLMLYPIALKLTQEQAEEVGKTLKIIDMIDSFGDDKTSLLLIDIELGKMV